MYETFCDKGEGSVVGYTCHIYENDHSQTDEKRQ